MAAILLKFYFNLTNIFHCLCLFLSFVQKCNCKAPELLWTFSFSSKSEKGLEANGMALSKDGDKLIVVGSTWEKTDTKGPDDKAENLDAFVAVYKINPQEPTIEPEHLWTDQFGSPTMEDEAFFVVAGNRGDVYVCGKGDPHSMGTDDNSNRGYIVKYDNEGKLTWWLSQGDMISSISFGFINSKSPESSQINCTQSLTGCQSNPVPIKPTSFPTTEHHRHLYDLASTFLSTSSPTYNETQEYWLDTPMNVTHNDQLETSLPSYAPLSFKPSMLPSSIPVSINSTLLPSFQNVSALNTTQYEGEVIFGAGIQDGHPVVFVVAADNGNLLEVKVLESKLAPKDVVFDPEDNSIRMAADMDCDGKGHFNFSALSFNQDLSQRWKLTHGGEKNTQTTIAHAIVLGLENHSNTYIGGYTTPNVHADNSRDAYVALITETIGDNGPLAELKWVRQFGTDYDDMTFALAPASEGGVYVTGQAGGPLPSCQLLGEEPNGKNVFVMKLDVAGNQIWCTYFGTFYDDFGKDLAVNYNTNILYSLGRSNTYDQGSYLSITAIYDGDVQNASFIHQTTRPTTRPKPTRARLSLNTSVHFTELPVSGTYSPSQILTAAQSQRPTTFPTPLASRTMTKTESPTHSPTSFTAQANSFTEQTVPPEVEAQIQATVLPTLLLLNGSEGVPLSLPNSAWPSNSTDSESTGTVQQASTEPSVMKLIVMLWLGIGLFCLVFICFFFYKFGCCKILNKGSSRMRHLPSFTLSPPSFKASNSQAKYKRFSEDEIELCRDSNIG